MNALIFLSGFAAGAIVTLCVWAFIRITKQPGGPMEPQTMDELVGDMPDSNGGR